jgi:hypothetical protein
MTNASSQKKLTPNEAQRIIYDLTTRAMRQIDVAARSPLARERTRAMRRLRRAIAAVTEKNP